MWRWKKKTQKSEYEKICEMTPEEREKEYLRRAHDGWDAVWDIIHTEEDWHLVTGADLYTGIVYNRCFRDIGKVFRLEGLVEASPEVVFEQLVYGDNDSPVWNPTVLECKTLHVINENTDIAYNVSMEGAAGLISHRDFVNLRHWKEKEGIMLSLGLSVPHPDMPPTKKYVRAENKPSAWAFRPFEGDSTKCHFTLLLRIDLKGWLPHYVVDATLSSVMTNYLVYLRRRIESLKS